MTGKTHMLGGIAFGAASALIAKTVAPDVLPNVQLGAIVMGSTVGSLIPDIDHPNSVISRKIPLIAFFYRIVAFFDKLAAKLLHFSYSMGHRGITHSIIPVTTLLALLCVLGRDWQIFYLLLGLLIGCYSHIAFDMLNPSGVPILLPVSKKRFRLIPKKLAIPTKNVADKSKAWKENLFAILVLVIDAVLIYILMKGVKPV